MLLNFQILGYIDYETHLNKALKKINIIFNTHFLWDHNTLAWQRLELEEMRMGIMA